MYCEKIYELGNNASFRLLESKSETFDRMSRSEFDSYVNELEELICAWEECEPMESSRAHAVWERQHASLERLLDMAMTYLGEKIS